MSTNCYGKFVGDMNTFLLTKSVLVMRQVWLCMHLQAHSQMILLWFLYTLDHASHAIFMFPLKLYPNTIFIENECIKLCRGICWNWISVYASEKEKGSEFRSELIRWGRWVELSYSVLIISNLLSKKKLSEC